MNNNEFLLTEKHRISAICAENDEDYESRLELAGINVALGDMDAVIQCCKELIEINPCFPDGHYNLGHALHRLGKVDEALVSYNKALHYDPAHTQAHLNIGLILRKKGRYSEAYESFEKVVELEPTSAEALFGCGVCSMNLESFSEAAGYFSEFLKYKPDSSEARCKLGISLLQLGHLKESFVEFCMAEKIAPMNAESYFYKKSLQREINGELTTLKQPGVTEGSTSKADGDRIHGSIIKAIKYFRAQKYVTPDYPYIYSYLQRKFGIEALFSKDVIEHMFFERNKKVTTNSPAKDNFILFYRLIDEKFLIPDHILDRQSQLPIDGTTLQALYCDQWSSFNLDVFLRRIDSDIDLKGYYLTHALIALMFIKENNCMGGDEALLLEQKAVIGCLDLLLAAEDFDDLSIEAVAILQYAGYHHLIKHEWIQEIISAQKDDGGWLWCKQHEDTHTHTSVLALWSLLEYTNPRRSLKWVGSMS